MNFDDPRMVESIAYDLKLGDWPRALQRARINDIANGKPPYTPEEVQTNSIPININDLTHTRAMQQARAQFASAFTKPPHYFTGRLDSGPRHKRQEWNGIATQKAARIMKRSLLYFECQRSKFASNVLHGIGPAAWEDRDKWCPDPFGVEDVLLPMNTWLTMKNLPFFFVYRSMTPPELIKLTTGPHVDPGWNMDMVQSSLEWMDNQMMQLRNNNWPEVWSPEKQGERLKAGGGWYAGDRAPRIDCFDFYFWHDEGKQQGWRRRMILDPWSTPEASGTGWTMSRKDGELYERDHGFMFNPGKRVYARKLSELITFQFADLSAVAPFRYHTVRSLGWLLFATCHMQNRLRCAVNRHLFENLMQLFRVKSQEDFQRALKIELIDKGFLDDSVQLIPQAERWQINAALAQMGLAENRQIIEDSISNWSQNKDYSTDRTEKTKFQVMAEVSAATSMIGATLSQAYAYQEFEYREIFRRLCRHNSRDPDCREFRAGCMREGIPEEYLEPERWEIEAERVMGTGNKSMEMAIAEWLMQNRQAYDSQAQQEILRDVTLLVTDDSARTRAYVPEGPRAISSSQHDAQLSLPAIIGGDQVDPVEGQDHKQVIEVWLSRLDKGIAAVEGRGGMANFQELRGLQNLSLHVKKQVAMVARDPLEKEQVRQWMNLVGEADNYLKAYEQRLLEAMQQQAEAQAQGNGQMDPKDAAKIQATVIGAQVKAQNQRESHAQRMAQRALQFEQKLQQDAIQTRADIAKTDLETAQGLRHEAAHAEAELAKKELETAQELRHTEARHQVEQENAANTLTETPT